MPEHILPDDFGSSFAVINWECTWYKIPFIVLEDMAEDWFQVAKKNRSYGTKHYHGDHAGLLAWLVQVDENNSKLLDRFSLEDLHVWMAKHPYASGSEEKDFDRLKELLEHEMPFMQAYQIWQDRKILNSSLCAIEPND